MFLLTVAKYIKLTYEIAKLNLIAAMEYRAAFITQVVGMIVNDIGFILMWALFFQRFPSLNGWHFNDTLLLFAYATSIYGIVFYFFGGSEELSKTITRGELDYYLPLPKNILWHISVSKNHLSGLGDLIFGIIAFFLSGNISIEKTLSFIVMLILASILTYAFIIIVNSITFWVGNFEEASNQLIHTFIGLGLYPQNSFAGALKIVSMTIFPGYFAYKLPVEVAQHFDLVSVAKVAAFTFALLFFAIFLFNRGLKRYESGNLMNTRN